MLVSDIPRYVCINVPYDVPFTTSSFVNMTCATELNQQADVLIGVVRCVQCQCHYIWYRCGRSCAAIMWRHGLTTSICLCNALVTESQWITLLAHNLNIYAWPQPSVQELFRLYPIDIRDMDQRESLRACLQTSSLYRPLSTSLELIRDSCQCPLRKKAERGEL